MLKPDVPMAGDCQATGCASRGVPSDGALAWGAVVRAVAEAVVGRVRLDVLADAVRKHLPPLLDQVRVLHMARVCGFRDMKDQKSWHRDPMQQRRDVAC